MAWQATTGSILEARAHRRDRLAGVGSVIDIPAGTRLEVARVDERWDNVHAMIVQGCALTVDPRVLDGGSRGEIVTEKIRGEVLICLVPTV
jgi:hypothetical protein